MQGARDGTAEFHSSRPHRLHFVKIVYIAAMLATSELIREAAQIPQLEELLPRWREVPLYRDSLAREECKRPHFECFRSLPLLAKRDMRNGFPRNFLSNEQALDSLLEKNLVELEHTSGTSEERLPVVFGRGWWNAQEERALRLNGLVARILDEHPNIRRATLVPPACNGLTCPTVWMSREQRTVDNTLYVNLARIPFLLSDADLARMAMEIAEWSPQFLDLDPVHGVRFALYCEQHGIQFPSVRFVLCSYEFVSVVHRRILARVFGVPVYNLYGSTETGHLLMENERGEMKPSYDTAFLEIVNADAHGIGHLVVTTLTNDYMPLLRYRIGDLAERIERPYASNFIVHGRSRDALAARDGRRVTTWQVDQCFAGVDGIAHYELRQDENGDCVLRFVPDGAGPGEGELVRVSSQLDSLLALRHGFKAEAMPVLVPTASGKFRLTHRGAQPDLAVGI
jgi:phenylacetate-coenzyme A ligase PaaK-like adenylate-forming protein